MKSTSHPVRSPLTIQHKRSTIIFGALAYGLMNFAPVFAKNPDLTAGEAAPFADILGCVKVVKGIVCLIPVHQAVRRCKDHRDIRRNNQGEKYDPKVKTKVLLQKPLQKLMIESQ